LVNGEQSGRLTEQIKGLRKQLAEDMGFVLPSVRIQDNLQLPANGYVVSIKEIKAGEGEVRPDMLLCMNPSGEDIGLPGEKTREPTFGLPAMWVSPEYREEAHFKGYTVVDAPTVITTHVTEIVKDNMAEILSYSETQALLDKLSEAHQKLVADVVPSQVSVGAIQRVLQNLISERVSIRDLSSILEGISEATNYTQNIAMMTEHVRTRLARQICYQHTNAAGMLTLVSLSPEWEQSFAESLIGDSEEKQLAMPPSQLQEFITKTRQVYEELAMQGESPVLLTSPIIRPYVRSIIERFRPQTIVMSQNEIYPKAKIKTMAQI
jgi:flagellar biosynthesis protein FlhA